MMESVDIAVVGATGLIGGATLERLAESDIPIGKLFPLASDDSDGEVVPFGSRHLTVHSLSRFDFSQVQIVILCVPPDVVMQILPRLRAQPCWVIDHSTALRGHEEAALVVASVNADDIAQARASRLIASPDSAVNMLAPLLQVLDQHNRVVRMGAVILRAVSDIGKRGIDELSNQSIALFNLKPIVSERFRQQIAFNVIPAMASAEAHDYNVDQQMETELRQICHHKDLQVTAMTAHVPVFYGHSIAVQLQLNDPVDIGSVQQMIKKSPLLRLVDDSEQDHVPSPVTHGVNQEGLFIGRLLKDPGSERGLCTWLVADNVHQAAAINGVQITEILVKDYL